MFNIYLTKFNFARFIIYYQTINVNTFLKIFFTIFERLLQHKHIQLFDIVLFHIGLSFKTFYVRMYAFPYESHIFRLAITFRLPSLKCVYCSYVCFIVCAICTSKIIYRDFIHCFPSFHPTILFYHRVNTMSILFFKYYFLKSPYIPQWNLIPLGTQDTHYFYMPRIFDCYLQDIN